MKIIIANSEAEFGRLAFKEIKDVLESNPACTLGLATGSTPIPLYNEMAKDHNENGTSYKNVKTFNLDEYVGLPKEHPESYISFMTRNLFSRVDIDMKNVNIPNGLASDIPAECARYSALLEKASVDSKSSASAATVISLSTSRTPPSTARPIRFSLPKRPSATTRVSSPPSTRCPSRRLLWVSARS